MQGEDGKEAGEGVVAPELEERKKTSSIIGASFNFTNSIIGAGIIGEEREREREGRRKERKEGGREGWGKACCGAS